MRAITQFAHLMSSTLAIAQTSGLDTYGKPTYGADASYRAHLQQGNRLVTQSDGQQVTANVTAHLMGKIPLSPSSRITLSTGDVGSTAPWMLNPRIVAVEERYDQGGLHHTVVHMQFAPHTAVAV